MTADTFANTPTTFVSPAARLSTCLHSSSYFSRFIFSSISIIFIFPFREGLGVGFLSLPFREGPGVGFLPPLGRAGVGLYRSALIGLFRKSSYANRMPSSSSVLYVQPRAVAFDTSSNFRGVPFGRVVSQRMAPS